MIKDEKPDMGEVSDGYHTFNELYDHRITLFIALCRIYDKHIDLFPTADGIENGVWRSKMHSDGSQYDGWFVLGIGKNPGYQITYHLPLGRWDETGFAETLVKAPEFDGHSSNDVLERLKGI